MQHASTGPSDYFLITKKTCSLYKYLGAIISHTCRDYYQGLLPFLWIYALLVE